jgi:hypothetical protein
LITKDPQLMASLIYYPAVLGAEYRCPPELRAILPQRVTEARTDPDATLRLQCRDLQHQEPFSL